MLDWLFNPSDAQANFLENLCDWSLVAFTFAVLVGVIFEYLAEFIGTKWFHVRKIWWAILIAVGLAGEFFTEAGSFGYALRLQASEANTIADLAGVAHTAKKDADTAITKAGTALISAATAKTDAETATGELSGLDDRVGLMAKKEADLKASLRVETARLTKQQQDLASLEKEEADAIAKTKADIAQLNEIAGPRHLKKETIDDIILFAKQYPGTKFAIRAQDSMGAISIAVDMRKALIESNWVDVGGNALQSPDVRADGIKIYCGMATTAPCMDLTISLQKYQLTEIAGGNRVSLDPQFPADLVLIVVGTRP